ncbi:MAG: class I SAM-dependent methyltransferase [Azospirillum sp.]|nr:class I SAM-dependent methyltransferase [Azospirillum sp.]
MERADAARLLAPVAVAYDALAARHGATPAGIACIDDHTQRLRFAALAGILPEDESGLVINDLGCGYGALFGYLADHPALRGGLYHGYDICERLIGLAQQGTRDPRTVFVQSLEALWTADYSFVSGTYNFVSADYDFARDGPDLTWTGYIEDSLLRLAAASRRGLAFNLLSGYADQPIPGHYYGDPLAFFDFCRRHLSPRVRLIHDYALPEWTIYVRL